MVSSGGQTLALPRASAAGGVEVQEFGYGLGPPDGLLVLRYPPGPVATDFPEGRDDFLHQVFCSPDGVLAVRRGMGTRYLAAGELLWVRRGTVAAVRGLGSQTVLRACVRRVPEALLEHPAAVFAGDPARVELLVSVARPGVGESDGLAARQRLLDGLAAADPEPLEHRPGGEESPAHLVARALQVDPADGTGLADWAQRLHVSTKTLQRDLQRVHGISFTQLRTRTRLEAAVALLADHTVTEVGHLVGYATTSAFVAAFTREHGEPPGRYVHARLAG